MFPALWMFFFDPHQVCGAGGLTPIAPLVPKTSQAGGSQPCIALTEKHRYQIGITNPMGADMDYSRYQFDRVLSLKIPICLSWSILLFVSCHFWSIIILYQPVSTFLSTEKCYIKIGETMCNIFLPLNNLSSSFSTHHILILALKLIRMSVFRPENWRQVSNKSFPEMLSETPELQPNTWQEHVMAMSQNLGTLVNTNIAGINWC